jgi:hypothetical protein
LITPSVAEYWHIGETAMRFLRVTSLRGKGSKSDNGESDDMEVPWLGGFPQKSCGNRRFAYI